MDLLVTHDTALHYLRTQTDGVRRRTPRLSADDGRAIAAGNRARRPVLFDVTPLPDEVPFHIAVADKRDWTKVPGISCHVVSERLLPARSFVPVTNGVYAASPELCFVNMAGELPFLALVELGFELCGSYSIDSSDERGFTARTPLTTAAALHEFSVEAGGMHGSKAARRAAALVLDGSASPMETALAMLLCLPPSLGGYGFARPELNGVVKVPPSKRRRLRASQFKCDMLWRDCGIALEYDSNQYHTGKDRIAQDATRRNSLKQLDIDVIVATSEKVRDANRFDELVRVLAASTGQRVRIRNRSFFQRRWELRRALFGSDRLVP